ncbi:MAG TPA: dienelactone hydrolase family protein [Acidimicrobiales bacterium]|nr:dienelactone hydrolase family protein [Acidimicrobiales bacterium]
MAEVVLFHHAQGLTAGTLAFADRLRGAGHVVHVPDLYEGWIFASLDEGVDFARSVGFDVLLERGVRYADQLPRDVVYAGFSLGVLPAQKLAQTRDGARGALLMSAAFPPSEFECAWPPDVPVQIHMMQDDEWVLEGDLDAARDLAATVENATLYLYPGAAHLFADSSLTDYDEAAATLLSERVVSFLDQLS